MPRKSALHVLFAVILVSMLVVTTWASARQSMFAWGGLTGPDRFWTIATLMDAYFGFLTFYVWVLYKETRALPRLLWFIAIMCLGNMAMSAYVLLQLARQHAGATMTELLTSRNT